MKMEKQQGSQSPSKLIQRRLLNLISDSETGNEKLHRMYADLESDEKNNISPQKDNNKEKRILKPYLPNKLPRPQSLIIEEPFEMEENELFLIPE